MYSKLLREQLTALAHEYGNAFFLGNYIHPAVATTDSVIFKDIRLNFNSIFGNEFFENPRWKHRLEKFHTSFAPSLNIKEMQSCNSSDALAMNVFCHPEFKKWKGVRNLFGVDEFSEIKFGFFPGVKKAGLPDSTEVDVAFNEVFCECKLTESDFTQMRKSEVEKYDLFESVFHKELLTQTAVFYDNYQLIRNILAAAQYDFNFILICDSRRPDLTQRFIQTVTAIKDDFKVLRSKCRIVFWQDIAMVSGKQLQVFLQQKYAI